MRRPLFLFALAWIMGLVLADRVPPRTFLILLTAILCGGLIVLRRSSKPKVLWGRTALLLLAISAVAYVHLWQQNNEYRAHLERIRRSGIEKEVGVRGRLASAFNSTSGVGWRGVLVDCAVWTGDKWSNPGGKIEVRTGSRKPPEGQSGDTVSLVGDWRHILPASLPGEFDQRAWNQARGVVGSVWAEGGDITVAPPGSISWVEQAIRWRDKWRSALSNWMVNNLSAGEGPLALAVTTGNRSLLPPQFESDLYRSGLLHLTAVSGLNITVALLVLPWCFKLVGVSRRWRGVIGLPLAVALLALVGAQASVVRATLMGMALMVAVYFDRPRETLNLLAAAALAILIPYPTEYKQPGFLLSFCTVLALIFFGPSPARFGPYQYRMEMFLQRRISPAGWTYWGMTWVATSVVAAIWTSVVATLAVAPITATFFHSISWGGILGNIVAVPLSVAVTILGAFAAFGLAFLPGLDTLVAIPLGGATSLLSSVIELTAGIPSGYRRILAPDPVIILGAVSVLVVLGLPAEWRPNRLWNRRTLALGLLAVLAVWSVLPSSPGFRVLFFDVGQGDSSLLRFPEGRNLLIDSGPASGRSEVRGSPLVQALLSVGVRRLDGVVFSHPEADHIGGVEDLLAELEVGAVYASGDVKESETFARLRNRLAASSQMTERMMDGDTIDLSGETSIKVLHPTTEDLLAADGSANERSVVLHIEQDGLNLLFMGDVGEEVELQILERHPGLKCDVLKVAHHGSRFSSHEQFLAATRPQVAVISCGPNSFGHPAPEAVRRIQESGATVYTTLHHGTIDLSWDGETLQVFTAR